MVARIAFGTIPAKEDRPMPTLIAAPTGGSYEGIREGQSHPSVSVR